MARFTIELLQLILEQVAASLARLKLNPWEAEEERLMTRPASWAIEEQLLNCMLVSRDFYVSISAIPVR